MIQKSRPKIDVCFLEDVPPDVYAAAPVVINMLASSRAVSRKAFENYARLFQTSVSVLNCVIDVGIIRRHVPLIRRAALHFQIHCRRSFDERSDNLSVV